MIVDKYIRYYYNVHGGFDKTMKFYDIIEGRANYEGMPVNSYLYSRLGYTHTLALPADKLAKLRQLAAKGDYNYLSEILGINSVDEINKMLDSVDAIPSYIKKISQGYEVLDSIASAVANYMKTVTGISFNNVTLAKFALMLRHYADEKDLNALLSSKALNDMVDLAMPKFVVKSGCRPYVTGGVCFVPKRLYNKDYKYITMAIKRYLARPLYLNSSESEFCKNACLNINDLYEKDNLAYLKIIDIANANELTVKELVNSLGYRMVDIEKQIDEDKIIYYLNNSEEVTVYTMQSRLYRHYLSLTFYQFKELYEKDILRFFDWNENNELTLQNEEQILIFNQIASADKDNNSELVENMKHRQLELLNTFGG